MRAIRVERFGGPEVLEYVEVPDPVPGPGQVLIEVAAADTLFVETVIRSGGAREFFDFRPPYIPGGAVSGKVRATGEGVYHGLVGRRVASRTSTGAYAELAVADAGVLLEVPDGVPLTSAAALMHDGVTALALAEPAPLDDGQRVLVTAAAGGLGLLLLQLAKASGAEVIGAARGRRKLDRVSRTAADLAVDYSDPGWTKLVREAMGGAGVDVVFDGAGGDIGLAAFDLTVPGGWFSAHGAPNDGFATVDPGVAARAGITVRGITDVQLPPDRAKALARRALDLAADGDLTPFVGQTYPLDRAAAAHEAIESRTALGKTLLMP